MGGGWAAIENLSPREAVELQRRLRRRVVARDDGRRVRRIGAVDVAYPRLGVARAAAVVVDAETLSLAESATTELEVGFPYVPGLLAFREAPAAIVALKRLSAPPDLLLVDGHGRAHPRRFGLACFLGLELDVPTIGVGKSLLVGEHDALPAGRGSRRDIRDRGEVIGSALRTRTDVRPVYVSIGHLVTLETAVRRVLACAPRYRLPEPLRLADAVSRRAL